MISCWGGRRAAAQRLALTATLAVACSGCNVLHIPNRAANVTGGTADVLVNLPPGIREGVLLAFDDERNGRLRIDLKKNTVRPVTIDDVLAGVHDAGAAAQKLHQLLTGDDTVLGLIGPSDVRAAERMLPIASNGGLLTIAPHLEDDCLTQQLPSCPAGEPNRLYPKGSVNGQRGAPFFFDMGAPLSSQAPAAADQAYNVEGRRVAVVAADSSAGGTSAADAFARRFTDDGGVVQATVKVDAAAALGPAVSAFVTSSPDVVYLAGTDPARMGDLVSAIKGSVQISAQKTRPLIIGAEQLVDSPAFLTQAGPAAVGTEATSVEADATLGRPDIAARIAVAYPSAAPVRGYAVSAYFAGIIMLQAISEALAGSAQGQAYTTLPASQDVLAAFLGPGTAPVGPAIDAGEALGSIQFDPGGTTLDKVLTIEQVSDMAGKASPSAAGQQPTTPHWVAISLVTYAG